MKRELNKYLIEHYEKAFESLEDYEALAIVNSLKERAKSLLLDAFIRGEMEKFNYHKDAVDRFIHAQQVYNILFS